MFSDDRKYRRDNWTFVFCQKLSVYDFEFYAYENKNFTNQRF